MRLKIPILGKLLSANGMSFHNLAPDFVIKVSAIFVFTRGIRRKLDVRVG